MNAAFLHRHRVAFTDAFTDLIPRQRAAQVTEDEEAVAGEEVEVVRQDARKKPAVRVRSVETLVGFEMR